MVVHFLDRTMSESSLACGAWSGSADWTTIPGVVTCRRCARILGLERIETRSLPSAPSPASALAAPAPTAVSKNTS